MVVWRSKPVKLETSSTVILPSTEEFSGTYIARCIVKYGGMAIQTSQTRDQFFGDTSLQWILYDTYHWSYDDTMTEKRFAIQEKTTSSIR